MAPCFRLQVAIKQDVIDGLKISLRHGSADEWLTEKVALLARNTEMKLAMSALEEAYAQERSLHIATRVRKEEIELELDKAVKVSGGDVLCHFHYDAHIPDQQTPVNFALQWRIRLLLNFLLNSKKQGAVVEYNIDNCPHSTPHCSTILYSQARESKLHTELVASKSTTSHKYNDMLFCINAVMIVFNYKANLTIPPCLPHQLIQISAISQNRSLRCQKWMHPPLQKTQGADV